MLNERFWSKVNKNSALVECWVWTANKNNKGYGLFRPGGSKPKALAHRLSFEAANGTIPDGALILHSCDNPACVNPAHLRVGSHQANVSDMDARGRRVSNPQKGERNTNATLSDATVVAMRRAYVCGYRLGHIAARFGISDTQAREHCLGKGRRHLDGVGDAPSRDAIKAEAAKRRRSNGRLNQALADTIRARLASGETGRTLAAEYGVHFGTVSDIKRGLIWPAST